MSLLAAFESAARHESFTRAAQELALTQSAVSRQVQVLEELLELPLFIRSGRRISLTEAGKRYHKEIAHALALVRDATMQAIAYRQGGGVLHLAVSPSVGTKWLMPRIHSFHAQHPGILIHLHSRSGSFDLGQAGVDAAISSSPDGLWPNADSEWLFEEKLAAVRPPGLALPASGQWLDLLQQQLLLQVASRPNSWRQWYEQHGMPLSALRLGPVFELTSHMVQAVSAQVGLGLVASFLVEDELRAGSLALACDAPKSVGWSYYLFTRKDQQPSQPLISFRNWLASILPTEPQTLQR